MSADCLGRASPRYDAFVVRLWRGEIGTHLARAEVEHVGSGARVRAVAVPTTWVLRQILAHLRASPSSDAATTGDQPRRRQRTSERARPTFETSQAEVRHG